MPADRTDVEHDDALREAVAEHCRERGNDGFILTNYVVITEWADPNRDPSDVEGWLLQVDGQAGDPPWRRKGLLQEILDRDLLSDGDEDA